MIKQYSHEWKNLLKQLKRSKNKSNRDVLCVKCWEVLTYERNIKHKLKYPDHSELLSPLPDLGLKQGLLTFLKNLLNSIFSMEHSNLKK